MLLEPFFNILGTTDIALAQFIAPQYINPVHKVPLPILSQRLISLRLKPLSHLSADYTDKTPILNLLRADSPPEAPPEADQPQAEDEP